MKKLVITTLSFFTLLIATAPITHAQFYYYDYNNGSNDYQQQQPNYYYQYSGPPTAEAMEQLNKIMQQFFSQNNFSGGNFMEKDFSFNFPPEFFSQQAPGIPNSMIPYLPNFQNYSIPQIPNNGNSLIPQAPITEKAPSYKESPDIYY